MVAHTRLQFANFANALAMYGLLIARRLILLAVWMLAAPLLAAPQAAPRDCPFDPQQYPAAREIHEKVSRLASSLPAAAYAADARSARRTSSATKRPTSDGAPIAT